MEVLALELASFPTVAVKMRAEKLYFYLWSEEPFFFLMPLSCGAVYVGVSRPHLKDIHFQQTSS